MGDLGAILGHHGLQDASKMPKIPSKTPPRPPKTLPRSPRLAPRRFQYRARRLQEASRRLQDGQDRLQDASKAAKKLPNASRMPKISSMMPLRRSISLPRPSKMFGSFFKSVLPCQVHANSLPFSEIRQRFLSAMAKHDGRLPSPWPLTKGGLAVVRPRRASSIRLE